MITTKEYIICSLEKKDFPKEKYNEFFKLWESMVDENLYCLNSTYYESIKYAKCSLESRIDRIISLLVN